LYGRKKKKNLGSLIKQPETDVQNHVLLIPWNHM